MYDGIFEDVEHVKHVLASHGHTSVDETLVFELLEDLKVKEHVVKVLLGNRFKLNPNLDNSRSPNLGSKSKSPSTLSGDNESIILPDTIEDSNSSDGLEVLVHNVTNGAAGRTEDEEAVDLTMDDNQSSSASTSTSTSTSTSNSSKISDHEETKTKTKTKAKTDEPMGTLARDALIDLTKETMEVKEGCCKSESFKDTNDGRAEEADANNSASDSESEMDDYYRRLDMESEESDGKMSPLASPVLPICQNFENPSNNEAMNLDTGDNRMEEMLEENNNDPNNNLEDIEVMEQNNGSATTTENLNIPKEPVEERCQSPKPGCSKDSYYADTDFCTTEGAASNGNQKFVVGKRPNIANIFEDEDFLVRNSVGLSDTKIGEEVFLIQKILPHYTKAKILSTIVENQEAVNRVELALWELLPDVKPDPVFHPKRKQPEDNCPAPAKKFLPGNLDSEKNSEAGSSDLVPKVEATTSAFKGIVKPATLKVPESKKSILKPPTLEFLTSKFPPAPTINSKYKSTLIKPGRLHLQRENIPNSISDQPTTFGSKAISKPPSKDNEAGGSEVNKTGAIPKKPKQALPLEKRAGDRAELIKDPKKIPKPTDYKILRYDSPQTIVAKESKRLVTLIEQNALAFQQLAKSFAPKDDQTKLRGLNTLLTRRIEAQTEAPSQLLGSKKALINNPEQGHFNNSKSLMDLPVPRTYNAAGHGQGVSVSQKSEAKVKLQAPWAMGAGASADVDPPVVEKVNVHKPWTAAQNPVQNDVNAHIAQRVGNMQLENENLLGNRLPNPVKAPKLDNRIQPLPVLDADEIREQLGNIPPAGNPLPPAGAERMEPARVEKLDPPKELFNPLINMFPDVDPNYIAELCITAKSKNHGLESLVEILLMNGPIHPRIINPDPEPQEMNPDIQYENLQGIFPDAHPEYLRGIAEKYYNDPDAMKNFVQAKLENQDYPTMADYLNKIKITEQIRQYTVDFSAEKFLQIFPNPLAHFENPKRVYRYNVIAFEFLKCHFRSNKVATIQKAYKCPKHPFHISLAAKLLELDGPDMKSRRSDKQLPTEDIPLLQEFAFIRHKAEIKEYIAAQELKEAKEFKRLKKNNELLECQCCYDGECMPSKCMECSEGHVFCKSCIKTGSETKIGEGQTQFPCFVECKGEFTLPVLQKVLEPTMFSILLRKRQEEEVKAAGLEGLVSCPFCHFASIPPPEDKVFKCLNPECMKETCRLCKELNHVPLRCDEVTKGEEARHYLEEKMTEALVRKCYRCSRPFFKDEGCNKMTCPCGATTCYICGEPVKDYKHFNGQGSDRTDLCPLWSDNKVLNAQTVRVVAQAAEKEILKKNPNLKIDAKALMPSIPQASRGPHQDIANAHVLPVQARRA